MQRKRADQKQIDELFGLPSEAPTRDRLPKGLSRETATAVRDLPTREGHLRHRMRRPHRAVPGECAPLPGVPGDNRDRGGQPEYGVGRPERLYRLK